MPDSGGRATFFNLPESEVQSLTNRPTYEDLKRRITELEDRNHAQTLREAELRTAIDLKNRLIAIAAMAITHSEVPLFLDKCLAMIGATLAVGGLYCWAYDADADTLSNLCEWTRQELPPLKETLQHLPAGDFAGTLALLRKNRTIDLPDVDVVQNRREKELLKLRNTKSLLMVPLFTNSTFFGFLMFAEFDRHRKWYPEDLERLRNTADIISRSLEHIMARKTIEANESQLRHLVENAPAGIYELDYTTNRFIEVNTTMCNLLGYTREELLAMDASDTLTPESRKLFVQRLSRLFTSKPVSDMVDFEVMTKDGRKYWTRLYIRFIYKNDAPTPTGAHVIVNEITDEKKSQRLLIKHKHLLETLVSQRTADLEIINTELKTEISRHKATEQQLIRKTTTLEEINTALKVVMQKREEDRQEIEQRVLVNVRQMVQPYLSKLKKTVPGPRQAVLLNIIESNLNDIVSPFNRNLSLRFYRLSQTETQVANWVKQGKSSKEIGELMNLSVRTVESYRNNIRCKLGIKKKKLNLRAHLLTLS